jgi:TRAP-type mannitol/chloroaromatic compound transport system permease large subunit
MVCTAGTLGQIIPPSTLLIILADVMSSAFQQAQYKQGKFSIETVSVGQTFAAALMPGLMLVVIYLVYLLVVAWLRPQAAPAMREATEPPTRMAIAGAIVPPVLLIFAVLGAILAGIASPNEAASVGAVGAILLAGRRQGASRSLVLAGAVALVALAIAAGLAPVRIQRSDAGAMTYALAGIYTFLAIVGLVAIFVSLKALLRRGMAIPALVHTMTLTSMIFATILMASFFSLDFVEISVILLPLIVPPLIMLGHDPIWLAVLIAVNLQTSFLTPPFGFSLFYLRSAAPPEVTTGMIYRGVAPFIGLQILAMALIWIFPAIATWLPRAVF